jgi:integrase
MSNLENVQETYAKVRLKPSLASAKPLSSTRDLAPMTANLGSDTFIKTFVESVFIPGHVELKSAAGRAHYNSILKYIFTPECVEQMFSTYGKRRRAVRKTRSGWPYLDDIKLHDLTEDRVRQLISCALSRGYSPQTLKHIRTVIGSIVKLAEREQVFKRENPIGKVDLPALRRRECHELTKQEAKSILKFLRYPEREVALLTMTTGMGVKDICALRWKDVNLTSVPAYHKGRQIPRRSIVVAKPSSHQAKRPVQQMPDKHFAISETLAAALIEVRQRRGPVDPDDFVVTAPNGDSQSQLTLKSLRLTPASKELRMPWLSWQVLRRAHQAFIEELRTVLMDELTLTAFFRVTT